MAEDSWLTTSMPLNSKNRFPKSGNVFDPFSQSRYLPKNKCIAWLRRRYGATFKRRRGADQKAAGPVTSTRFGLWSALAVSTVSVGFLALGVWELPEQQSYNLMHKARRELAGVPHWDNRVVVIAMDEASVKRKGFFPWNRDRHAELLQILDAGQPAAVVFDLFFADETAQDAEFATAIANSANVVLGVAEQETYLEVTPSISQIAEGYFLRGDIGTDRDSDGITRRLPLMGPEGVPSLAVSALQVSAQTLSSTVQAAQYEEAGQVGVSLSEESSAIEGSSVGGSSVVDGSVSNNSVGGNSVVDSSVVDSSVIDDAAADSTLTASLVTSAVSDLDASSASANVSASTRPEDLLAPLLPKRSPVWVSWPGETATAQDTPGFGTLPVYSYIDVIEGRVNPSRMRNKIVLVGATTVGSDPMRSPFAVDHTVSGVHFFAAAINNLLNGSYLRRTPGWQCAILLVALALGTGYTLRRQGVYQRLTTVAAFPLGWGSLALTAFWGGWWVPVAAPIGTVLLGAIAVQLYEQQEKQQLMALFSMNVSSGTAELIWRHKGVILDHGELAAQTLTATVLFMDIRGFTSIAERLPSQQLLPWLNQYFETMTDCIMKHGGMVDKYIGDAIMAVFGAPVPRTEESEIQGDAIAALHAALEMHQRLKHLNRKLARQNLPTIEFGIGIHTGPLIGGTVGNRHRLNYSLFGDTVNIAARLETLTKALPDEAPFNILLSDSTRQLTRDFFPMQPFQSCQLQGRTGLTDIYTIAPPIAPDGALSDAQRSRYQTLSLNPYPALESADPNASA